MYQLVQTCIHILLNLRLLSLFSCWNPDKGCTYTAIPLYFDTPILEVEVYVETDTYTNNQLILINYCTPLKHVSFIMADQKRSSVWRFFTIKPADSSKVTCNICGDIISRGGQKKE